jgi:regulator of nonsense transcripts 1
MFLASMEGREEKHGNSFHNAYEAKIVRMIVLHLISKGSEGAEIGVITGYDGQKSFLTSNMNIPVDVEINTVDGFQGREKEVIIVSCVRSNTVGFLKEPRRMNVSLTRAKAGLIIIGNPYCLRTDSLWRSLLEHVECEYVLVSGELGHWTQFRLAYIPDKRTRIKKIRPRNKGDVEDHEENLEVEVPVQNVFSASYDQKNQSDDLYLSLYGF